MTSGPREPYGPRPTTHTRLNTWAQLAPLGVPVADIAHRLGITRRTLDRLVTRARAAHDPRAVYHRDAHLPGTGTAHLRETRARAAHTRRRAQETR